MNTDLKKKIRWQTQPWVKALLAHPGAELFLVGGAVRDALLKRPTADFDFVIRGLEKKQIEKTLPRYGSVSLVGKKFGVYKFVPRGWQNEPIDLALPRTEHTLTGSGAYKDFAIASDPRLPIEADLQRRDFTVNALAINIATNKLVDVTNGRSDLKNKIIRTVGKPEQRFREDYTRLLRCLRFAVSLDFTIEKETLSQIKKLIANLNKKIDGGYIVPRELIASELVKMLRPDPVRAVELLDSTGALATLMPELLTMKKCPQPKNFHAEGDVWVHTLLALKNLNSAQFKREFKNQPTTDEVRWALLFHDLGKPYTIVRADRLRYNNHDAVSAEKFRAIADRLKLSSGGINPEAIEQLIGKHMLTTHGNVNQMKATTLEKYFFSSRFPGNELLMVIFTDISASLPNRGKPTFDSYKKLKKRLASLQRQGRRQKASLPKPLLTGTELMKVTKLKSGPRVGELLAVLREAQLSGKIKTKNQALLLLKKIK